jgi:hypothetical protein
MAAPVASGSQAPNREDEHKQILNPDILVRHQLGPTHFDRPVYISTVTERLSPVASLSGCRLGERQRNGCRREEADHIALFRGYRANMRDRRRRRDDHLLGCVRREVSRRTCTASHSVTTAYSKIHRQSMNIRKVKGYPSAKYGVDHLTPTHQKGHLLHSSTKGDEDDVRLFVADRGSYLKYYKGHTKRSVSVLSKPEHGSSRGLKLAPGLFSA